MARAESRVFPYNRGARTGVNYLDKSTRYTPSRFLEHRRFFDEGEGEDEKEKRRFETPFATTDRDRAQPPLRKTHKIHTIGKQENRNGCNCA